MLVTNARSYIVGHHGLVGRAILRNLQARGYVNFALRTHAKLELERQADVQAFFERKRFVYTTSSTSGDFHAQ